MVVATWALVVVTFWLAVGAAWYAIETHKMVDRMDKEREAHGRPVLAFHLVPWEAGLVKLRIQNVGLGPAFSISGAIEAESSGEPLSSPLQYSLLTPGSYEEFGFPVIDNDSETRHRTEKVRQHFESIRARLTYKGADGKGYVLDDTINVRELTDSWIEARMMATQDHPERLMPRIARALDKIAGAVSKNRSVGGDRDD